MVTKIKRQDCLDKYQMFPLQRYDYEKEEMECFYPQVFKSYILTLNTKSFKGHIRALGFELKKLTKALHTDTLIFLGDHENPWLYQENNYKPVKEAQQYLRENKIGKRFNGALEVDAPELPTFTRHLAWLVRCNAALPNFHFTDPEQNVVGSICKYGNLHLDTLNKEADKNFKSFVENGKFEYGDRNSCDNWFAKTSAISGRQTIT